MNFLKTIFFKKEDDKEGDPQYSDSSTWRPHTIHYYSGAYTSDRSGFVLYPQSNLGWILT